MPPQNAPTVAPSFPPRDAAVVAILAVLVVTLGGYLCGLAVDAWGEFGGVAIWGTGWATGAASRRLVAPHRIAGITLAVAIVFAAVFAETCWIRWNIVGVESWPDALAMLPQFAREFSRSVLVAALMTFFGASSAYRQAGMRYRYVAVMDP